MSKLKLFSITLLFFIVSSSELLAQAGSLDLSFGINGIVTTDLGGTDHANAVVIQPDGKILIAGQKNLSVPADIALARYNPDGSPDNTFGTNGHVITDVTGNSDVAYSICLQPDGKILVSGACYTIFAEDVCLLRYNVDGSLDPTFGVNGITITDVYGNNPLDLTDNNDYGWTMALQPDGKIVVGGYSSDEGMDHNFTVFRYNNNGLPDATFDFDGIVVTPIGVPLYGDEIRGLLIQPDGKILVAGSATIIPSSSGYQQFVLVRYNSDGSLDTGFDNDGLVNTMVGNIHSRAFSIALQSNGNIVAAGVSYNGVDMDFALTRFLSDGSLDISFDGDGKLTTPIGLGPDWIYSMKIQPDGKIITCGGISYNNVPASYDFGLARYNIDGSLDASFDGDGKLTTSIGSSYAVGYSVALQADGKIVAAGWSNMGLNSDDITIVRYNNNIGSVGIAENNLYNVPDLYPNPSNGVFYIENSAVESQLSISNVLGSEVYLKKLLPKTTNEIDLTGLANGVYVVRVNDGDQIFIEKILKK